MIISIQTIRLEHYNIASVLACLDHLLSEIETGYWSPDFELLSSVVDYMERFAGVFHHPKEEDYLFKALARRKPDVAPVLELVHDEHVKGAQMLRDVRQRLTAYQEDAAEFQPFRQAVTSYIDFERRHMAREERELLPLALEVLKKEDWVEIDDAFSRNDDPLFGEARKRKEFQKLIQHLLEFAPAPLGFREREETV